MRESSFSADEQACVEVAVTSDGGRWLRDTKDRATPAHYYPSTAWHVFIRGVKDGEFD
ncbi:MAG: DUF397 domain-containing protein [Pseudonocardiaceae bacterium]